MTNPIVAKIQALWDEHITNVYMFPSDEAIDEAFDIWWDEGYLPDLS